jgi:glycosyltransferase involved in cell wall biosynthesis
MNDSSAPLRLLLSIYPPDGGAAQHVIDLVLGLDPERLAIDLVCRPGSEVWAALERTGNVTLHPLRGLHGRPAMGDLRDLPLLFRLAGRADVIHAHSSKAGFLTRLAAAAHRNSSRTLFTPHAWSFWAAGGVEGHAYIALERLGARWCRILIAVSHAERAAGLAAGVGRPEQYRVIPNGIDLELFAREPRPRAGRIVLVGRLASQKRVDLALEAFRTVREALPEATLDVVGDGPFRRRLEELAGRLEVRQYVRFLGARADLPDVLNEAACLLLASDYEGCPLSVLEAMAAGLPVVATAVGGVPELVVDGETGVLAEPGSSAQLASGLRTVLSSPELARALGSRGRERARRLFARERMVRETCALYEEIAASAAAREDE